MGDRRKARELALQMLYQWEVGKHELSAVLDTFWEFKETPAAGPVRAFASELMTGAVTHAGEIDRLIAEQAEHWRLSRMAATDRNILRLAVYEFLYAPETPKTVVINEALEIAKKFGSEDSAKFINGVLDGIQKKLKDREAHGS